MAKVKLDLRSKTVGQKADLADNLVTNMTGNPAFAAPNPALAALTTLASAARAKLMAVNDAKSALNNAAFELDQAEKALDDGLTAEGAYIQSASAGDPAKITSSGAEVAGTPAPTGPLHAPQNLSATGGDQEGTADGQWEPVHGGQSYIAECATSATGPWTQVYVGTRSSFTATGLVSGTQYWFRVRAVGASGQSPWSDPATKRAT